MIDRNFYNIVLDCLDKHAEEGSRRALLFVNDALEVEIFTFQQLAEQTQQFARGLIDCGFKTGDRLILSLLNGPEFPVAFLGAVRAGVIPIPSSPLLTRDELDFLRRDSGAKEIVSQENFLEFIKGGTFDIEMRPTFAFDPAFWLYTSGTEGTPKAVIHAHRSIPAHDERVRLWQNLQPDDVVFNTSSLNWSYALTCGLLDVWRHGVTTVIYSGNLKPEKILRVIEKCGVTVLMSVPGLYRRLAAYFRQGDTVSLSNRYSRNAEYMVRQAHHVQTKFPLNNVRVCLSAGEKLPEEVRTEFKRLIGLEIYEGLGMTEHSVYLVQRYGEPIVPGSCGKPLPGSRVAILRDDLTECPAGEIGILASHRSCPGLMLGYYREEIRGEWFLSGDLAYKDEKGNFFFVGRRDDVITAGGYRISPMEVEAVLNWHPDVLESAVVGREIEPGKTIIVACVVCRGARSCTATEEIITHASHHLAKYKVPREVVFVDVLPKSRNGKIKRRELFSSRGLDKVGERPR